ncbi:MAG: response regulator transcription factor [Chloroflexota bacterium]
MNITPNVPLRVLILDDQAGFRRTLSQLLAAAGLQVVGEAGDIPTAQALAESLQPDLAVIDLFLEGVTGIQAAHRIRQVSPLTRLILVSAYDGQVDLFQSAAAAIGAESFIPKDALDLALVRTWVCGPQS